MKRTAGKSLRTRKAMEQAIHLIFLLCGIVAVGFVLCISVYLVISGLPAIREIGLTKFLFGKVWAPTNATTGPQFGILPFLLTSVYGTAGALLLGVPVGLMTAIFLAKAAPPRLADGLMEAAVSLCQAYVDQPFRLMWSGETTSVREITGEEQLPEAVTALLKSKAQEEPQPPELRPEGKLLYCCTQLPADGQLPEDAVVLLCSDEPCTGEGVYRFTPEDMQEILGKWMWN